MTAAAAAQAYEHAGALRDKLKVLRWLHDQLERMRRAQAEGALVYPVAGHDGSRLWYLIHGGRTVAAVPAPENSAASRRAAAQIEEVYRLESPADGGPLFEHFDGVLLVAAWFRRHPEERARTLQPAEALAQCRRAVRET